MIGGLHKALRVPESAALRKCIAIICVSFLVFSSIVHSACCPGAAPQAVAGSQLAGGADDGKNPVSPGASAAVHCHACAGFVMPSVIAADNRPVKSEHLAYGVSKLLTPGAPDYEPPPPKHLS